MPAARKMIKAAKKTNQKANRSVARSIIAAAPPLMFALNGIIAEVAAENK
jgi:hypothetical protein